MIFRRNAAGEPLKSTLFALLLLFSGLLWAAAGTQAAEPVGSPGSEPLPKSFAKVWRLSGSASASAGLPTTVRYLQVGDAVFVGERIEPARNSELVLQTLDQGYMAVRPGAAFMAERYSADGRDSDHVTLRLLQGGLRILTGWVGKMNPKDYRLFTPTATIGIRGTDHEAYFLNEELSARLAQPAGTYDKVNTGLTTLETADGLVEIQPGKAGFARMAGSRKSRALITLLAPHILESVPEFFVPGQFDGELDQLSGAATSGTPTVPEPANDPVRSAGLRDSRVQPELGRCNAMNVARAWLQRLDDAMGRGDSATVVALFAQQLDVSYQVATGSDGSTRSRVSRKDFVESAQRALRTVSQYQQKRLSVTAEPVQPYVCDKLVVKSHVLEQGRRNGQSFYFESTEEYVLERVGDFWVATRAAVVQK